MKVITKSATRAARGQGLTLYWGVHDFPIGKILVALSDEGLCWAGINCVRAALARNWPGAALVEDAARTAKCVKEISKLWPGKLDKLEVPVVLYGTPFQLKVWKELLKIRSGTTVTYGDVARKINNPAAVRAVGSAVGKNPVTIIVPCHRVVNKDSGTVNYLWGADIKTKLLKTEGAA